MATLDHAPEIVAVSAHEARVRRQIRDRLLAIIRASGLSVRAVAELSGVAPTTLARWIESGAMPLDGFLAVCRALRIDPGQLLIDDAINVSEARRIADLLSGLSNAERYALRSMIESAIELRTAAIIEDRTRAGERGAHRSAFGAGSEAAPRTPVGVAVIDELPTADTATPMPDDEAAPKRRKRGKP